MRDAVLLIDDARRAASRLDRLQENRRQPA
jgi:hypothetical protein